MSDEQVEAAGGAPETDREARLARRRETARARRAKAKAAAKSDEDRYKEMAGRAAEATPEFFTHLFLGGCFSEQEMCRMFDTEDLDIELLMKEYGWVPLPLNDVIGVTIHGGKDRDEGGTVAAHPAVWGGAMGLIHAFDGDVGRASNFMATIATLVHHKCKLFKEACKGRKRADRQ